MKEQSKLFVCLKKPNLLRRPNEDMEGQSEMDGWPVCSLEELAYQKLHTDSNSTSYSLIGKLLLEPTRPAGQCCLNVPQVIVCGNFLEWSNTST